MTIKELILSSIKNENYYLLKEHFRKEKVTIYKIVKDLGNRTTEILCEVAFDVARKIKKETDCKVVEIDYCVGLNFKPVSAEKGTVKIWS